MEFRRAELANGLEIIAECNPAAHSQALGFFVQTGARDEADDIAGVSHFLEHMLFKGTPRRSADDVNRQFDEIGAHYNAFTSEENTVYYAAVLPEHQTACVDILADIMRPSLRTEDFDTEKQVILEEIQMYLDQPPYGMDDYIKRLGFGEHPIARSVLGTADSITALSAQQMRGYFERRYSPGNMLVAAAGNVDFDKLVADVEERCGGWQRFDANRELPSAKVKVGFESVEQSASNQQYILQLGLAPAGQDADRYAAKLLASIVGDDSGSRLYWELVDSGVAETASLGHYDYLGIGMFYGWIACSPDDAEECLTRAQEIYQQVQAGGVTDEELAQVKNKVKSRVVLASEKPRSRLFNVGGNWSTNREYRTPKDDLRAIDAVTLSEIRAVLDKYPLTEQAVVSVGPRKIVV